MTNPPKPNSQSLRFLFIGGWTAIKSAIIGSVIVVFGTLILSAVLDNWQNGLQNVELSISGFLSLLSSAAFLLLAAILLSAVPAFIGGMILAWLLKRKNARTPNSRSGKISLGALIGALAGVELTALALIPADLVQRTAHGGYGYNFLDSLPMYLIFSIEIIGIATIAGIWTDRRLIKHLQNSISNDTV